MNTSYYTLGCKLNQAETDELKTTLEPAGFLTVPYESGEDISIIRACGVTCSASQTTREMIRRVKRCGAYVVATGCLENTDMTEIDFAGKNNKEVAKHLIKTFSPTKKAKLQISPKTRQFIKIQTGCNFQCSYCIIPKFRGKSTSLPAQQIIEKINQIITDGFKEIVLTGVNICQYNYENLNLAGLLKLILEKTTIPRIRLGSLDPRLITDELIKLYGENKERLLPHWHLSLQSGSDTVLTRMARGYTAKHYKNIVDKLRQHYPLFSITTDIIVGFPDESDEEFEQTCEFVKQINFCSVHVFPFSPRPNTPADKLKPVHNQTVTNRAKQLAKICQQVSTNYKKQFLNSSREILFEQKKEECFIGYSPEYFKVKYRSDKNLSNKIQKIKFSNENIL